jgi:hypothetical protein
MQDVYYEHNNINCKEKETEEYAYIAILTSRFWQSFFNVLNKNF